MSHRVYVASKSLAVTLRCRSCGLGLEFALGPTDLARKNSLCPVESSLFLWGQRWQSSHAANSDGQ